jgi:hypothetical protein
VTVSSDVIRQMIADADAAPIDLDVPRVRGKVTFEEFEAMMSCRNASKSATHWRTILEKVPLVKGTKKSLKMLQDLNTKKGSQHPPPAQPDSYLNPSRVSNPPSSKPSQEEPFRSPDDHHSNNRDSPKQGVDTPPLSDRDEAIRNAKWSLMILGAVALFRRLVFKI